MKQVLNINSPRANELFKVTWMLTRKCNYNCSYCPATKNTVDFASMDNIKTAVDKIMLSDKKKIQFTFTGGEPTLHPEFSNIVQYVLDTVKDRAYIHITTNLSKNIEWYKDFCTRFSEKGKRIGINASFHREMEDENEFISKLKILNDDSFLVSATVLFSELDWETSQKFHDKLIENGIRVIPTLIRNGTAFDLRYTKEQFEWFNKQSGLQNKYEYEFKDGTKKTYTAQEILADKELHSLKGYICKQGSNYIVIDADGTVRHAACANGQHSKNIFTDKLSMQGYDMVCTLDRCLCASNYIIPRTCERKSYMEGREELEYYKIVREYIKKYQPKTMLDVGCHGMDIFNEVDGDKSYIDFHGSFPKEGEHIKTDINEFDSDKKYEVVTCLQTLEHIKDIQKACDKLKTLYSKALIISLPYKWTGIKQNLDHAHTNIDMKQIIELLGEPNAFIRTKYRIIGVYENE